MEKLVQSMALFIVIASFASVTASPIRDWEDTWDEGGLEDGSPRSLIDERDQPLEDTEAADSNEIMEVAMPAKRQNFPAKPRKDLALVPLKANRASDIIDETAVTGENAKKRLPSYMRHNQPGQPSILHDINQVTTSLLPMGFQGKAD